jgi:hypothetical protein
MFLTGKQNWVLMTWYPKDPILRSMLGA